MRHLENTASSMSKVVFSDQSHLFLYLSPSLSISFSRRPSLSSSQWVREEARKERKTRPFMAACLSVDANGSIDTQPTLSLSVFPAPPCCPTPHSRSCACTWGHRHTDRPADNHTRTDVPTQTLLSVMRHRGGRHTQQMTRREYLGLDIHLISPPNRQCGQALVSSPLMFFQTTIRHEPWSERGSERGNDIIKRNSLCSLQSAIQSMRWDDERPN